MRFTLNINCDNAAFGSDPSSELGAVLARVTEKLDRGVTEGYVQDTNGNTVGRFELTNED